MYQLTAVHSGRRARIYLVCARMYMLRIHSTKLPQEKLIEFTDLLAESVMLARVFNPALSLLLGDFNAGNIYLVNKYQNHSGIT